MGNEQFTIGSLFDGSGGFPLASLLFGITPIWASEVKPYPIAVTKSRLPRMEHLGSITEIDGGKIPPVDVITFGSPCQDMSIAGKRAGIKHKDKGDEETTRSGLFLEAVRVIREMREATNEVYPRIAIWENVLGAFSSHGSEDFRCVLEELANISGGGGTLFLDLRRESGDTLERSWETDGRLPGECWMRNTGASPRDAQECSLWRVLIPNAPERYSLSAKACAGILKRGTARGKRLPDMILEACLEVVLEALDAFLSVKERGAMEAEKESLSLTE